MTLPQAWVQQAESDFRAAQRVDNNADARTRCQAISKYQQCVEKSVKGVLDKLHAAGVTNAHSDSPAFRDWFDGLAKKHGLKVLESKSGTIKMPWEEEKSDLEPYLTRLGRKPKLDADVAWRVVQK